MNESIVSKTSEYFRKKGVVLPTVSELCSPHLIDKEVKNKENNLENKDGEL